MKHLVVLFVFLSTLSYAQKDIFSLTAPLNLDISRATVDTNPMLNFNSLQATELVAYMQRNEMDNIPLTIVVSSNGSVQSINLSTNPSLVTFIKGDLKQLNKIIDKLNGLITVASPAIKNGKAVAFETTIVLNRQQEDLTINPILHN